jgi:hypothetical protein
VGAGAVGGLADDGSAVLGVGGEDAVVEGGVRPRPRDEGGQPGEEGADTHGRRGWFRWSNVSSLSAGLLRSPFATRRE